MTLMIAVAFNDIPSGTLLLALDLRSITDLQGAGLVAEAEYLLGLRYSGPP
jgi:hypothetical protein